MRRALSWGIVDGAVELVAAEAIFRGVEPLLLVA